MARYLVTGGCGFIGSHLCEALIARGDQVRVLDDLSSGHRDNLAPGAELMVGDIADLGAMTRALRGMDGCFHLAAIASVERGVQDPLGTHRVNLTGTITVFEAARAAPAALGSKNPLPVVYASSAAVYGDPARLPLAEGAPTRPLSAYGADKLGCEQHARVAGAVHGVPTLGLRFFNVFGPRQDPRSPYSGVISIFCERLVRNEPVGIYGDGGQTRDFVVVSDVVAALLAGMRQASTAAPVLNVCTGRVTTVRQLAELIGSVCGVEPVLRHLPARSGEIRDSLGSPDQMRALLGVGDPVALRTGLESVVRWLRAGRPGLAIGAASDIPEAVSS